MNKGIKYKKKEVEGPNYFFWITWSPSLLGDQAIKNKNFVLSINRWLHT
jgi:hypothetical protein